MKLDFWYLDNNFSVSNGEFLQKVDHILMMISMFNLLSRLLRVSLLGVDGIVKIWMPNIFIF
jgi:hypothetical protein